MYMQYQHMCHTHLVYCDALRKRYKQQHTELLHVLFKALTNGCIK